MKLRIGTRGSALALKQTNIVENLLKEHDPSLEIERVIIKTDGDIRTDKSLAEIGGKGLFVAEIEKRLQEGLIDIAVHSAKDLPSVTDEPFEIAAVLERANPKDVFLVPKNNRKAEADRALKYLKSGSCVEGESFEGLIIGTSSPRREELIKRLLPGCEVALLRGNVATRLGKLRDGVCDATLLAAAGLERLGNDIDTDDFELFELDPEIFIPGACQGIIAVEAVTGTEVADIIRNINHEPTKRIFDTQRKIMQLLSANCHDAAGVYATYKNDAGTLGVKAFFKDSDIISFDIKGDETEEYLNKILLPISDR